ncbi:hypothetical protein [Robbsia sp. KACC 23696]|uniref:hypothetical protein n=1 Tax=Robbsia sp. KACC 23696 TaxID=3149231 RepID=UPI00325C2FF8
MHNVKIGYYAHHHGSGHLQRAHLIARHMRSRLTIFTSAGDGGNSRSLAEIVTLPIDTDDRSREHNVTGLHYAPLALEGIARRMSIMSSWFRDHWPCVLVVDVSVEVALFARLHSVPVVYVRQNGARDDLPHRLAYAASSQLLSPFPEALSTLRESDEWREKTVYTDFISRFAPRTDSHEIDPHTVAVLIGKGGTSLSAKDMYEAAQATPHWRWTVLGPVDKPSKADCPENIRFMGLVSSPGAILSRSEIVIGSAGDNVVAEMASLRARFICFAEKRPFDEQSATGEMLARLGLALFIKEWPDASFWPALLARAAKFDCKRWDNVGAGGARKAALVIQNLANRFEREGALP